MKHYLKLEGLTKRFDENAAVDGVSLKVEEGELLAIVGPSGCGKTTFLRLIAGLEVPDEGTIYLGDEVLFSKERHVFIPPHKRQIGMVFQSYALWPHMSIFSNVAYPLKVAGLTRDEVRCEVGRVLSLLSLAGLEKRYPHQLSGGEQQRTALARALVMKPRMLLLDEPLSNLDAYLREGMRTEIKRIQKETGVTIIHVTHDQSEAMGMADRMAVMEKGKLMQVAAPRELYEHPRTEFVARFIGGTNLLPCRVLWSDGRKKLVLPDETIVEVETVDGLAEGPALLSVRPEDIVLSHNGEYREGQRPELAEGTIDDIAYLGNIVYCKLSGGGLDLRIQAVPGETWVVGEQVHFHVRRATVIDRR